MTNIDQKFLDLKNWIQSNGGFVNSKVDLINSQFGRTVIATEDLQDERIFTLPQNLTLNCKNSGLIIDAEFTYRNLVMIALLYEYHKPNSFWAPYLNLLPHLKEFKNHPQYLQATGNFPKVSEAMSISVETSFTAFTEFHKKLIEYNNKSGLFKEIIFEEVLWVYLCVITRMWSEVGLVPFADLLQHSNESPMAIVTTPDDLSMTGSFQSGDQVFDNYCVDDDLNLFLNFGFVDSTQTSILNMSFVFENQQNNIDFLIDGLINKSEIKKLILSSKGINQQLMKFLRLKFIDAVDLRMIDIDDAQLGDQAISLNNELKCLKKIRFRVQNLFSDEEINNATLQILNYDSNTPEYLVYSFIIKISKFRQNIYEFIDNYWSSFLSN
jgi:hypothetical protein